MADIDKIKKADLYTEVAVVADDFGSQDEFQDELLSELGGGLDLYDKLARDPQVSACYLQRMDAFVGSDWEVLPSGTDKADKMAADFLHDNLTNFSEWDSKNKMMVKARHYGFGVAELIFANDGKNIVIDNILVRKQSRFIIDKQKQLILMNGIEKKIMPDYKFWRFVTGADNDDMPMGLGLAYQLYWPVWFKTRAAKMWAIYLDKFASPTAVAKYPSGSGEDERKRALQAARAIRQATGIAVPTGVTLEFLEAGRSSGGDYKLFLEYFDAAIAKVILGQTGTTTNGPYSGTAETHMQVAKSVIKADADLLCGSFNASAAKVLTALNYPTAKPPRYYRKLETNEDRETRITEDKELFAMGWRRDAENFTETYGMGYERIEIQPENNGVNKNKAEFAEPNEPTYLETDLDAYVQKLGEEANPYLVDMLNIIKSKITKAKDYEEAMDLLLEALGEMDDSEMANIIGHALTCGCVLGMDDEAKSDG